ncbi:MAG TPA: single-stranded-DNA-specific exonuclease RecJ, partial [Alphaproteobacteria bacterium]|nr:single-stranded-DNA-specific exonuclease RecJ [Alphaproteobacteria bacterium]
MSRSACALDVQRSLGDKRWGFVPVNEDLVVRIAQNYNLPEFVSRLLVQRGVDPDDIEGFLNPTLRDHFPDPFSFAGMKEFADDLADCIINETPIGIFADFDVDGATSSAILTRFLRHFDIVPPVYIPDRLTEGYGPSVQAMQALKDQGVKFVIMADCGITAFEPLQAAHDMGLRVAVFDHHEPEGELPNAAHIINPKRADDQSGLDMLAACGVSFMACVAVNNALRAKGYFDKSGKPEAPLKSWLDLVALGTVCDMVPLKGVNRLFVKAGFDQMAHHNNQGIKALCQVGRIETLPEPKDAGWSIGPRINAGSRVHRSDLGAKLLSTDDPEEAQSIAWALEDCNQERKKIQSEMMQIAMNKVEFLKGNNDNFIMVDDESFHSGLSGLVAGRLKERYGKPAIVVTYVENEQGIIEGRGSGRSVPGVNMADIFISARNEGIVVKGGGHAMAGGFTVMPDRLDDFRQYIGEYIEKLKGIEEVPQIDIDAIATVRGAKPEFVKLLNNNVGPFGVGNPEPVFALADVKIHNVDVMKDKHIRLMISDVEGGTRMKAVFFSGVGTKLGDMMLKQS